MRIAYFQPFSGASGDMALGALVVAAAPLGAIEEGLRTLRLEGWRLEARGEPRGAFRTTRVKVIVAGAHEEAPQPHAPPAPDHNHDHDHQHHHHHDNHHHHHHHPHNPAPAPSVGAAQAHGHRGLSEIRNIIEKSGLPPDVKVSALRVFERLGAAEARVHGTSIEEVHFHEVGAVDSIIDICGTCLALHLLEIDEVRSAPVTVGTGFVGSAHGKLPLPAPATLELLKGHPVEQRDSRAELTTPTGAALLTTLASGFGTMPPLVIQAVGYGAGDDRPGPVPNALRVIIGETPSPRAAAPSKDAPERVVVLEASVDDMSPQWLGNLMDRLFEAGALDVSFTPITMKKSRPAQEIKVLAPLEGEGAVVRTLFEESTTLGLRRTETERIVLEREMSSVDTPWGPVKVKVGKLGDRTVSAQPEYEDLKRAAREAGKPLKEVHAIVLDLWRRQAT